MTDDDEWQINTKPSNKKSKPQKSRNNHQQQPKGQGRSSRNSGRNAGGSTSSASTTKKFGASWAKPTQSMSVSETTPKDKVDNDISHSQPLPSTTTLNNNENSTPTDDEVQEGFVMQSMASLLADYGEFDPHWMDQQPQMEDDVPTTDQQEGGGGSPSTAASTTLTHNRLGQYGKAPIHVDLISFGYGHGAPPRGDGWSPTQPLLPFDCRDALAVVPHYLQHHDGLSSGQVKRFLLYDFRRHQYSRKHHQNDTPTTLSEKTSVREYSTDTVAPQIWEALLECLRNGDYGYACPLKLKFHIGSDWGRHRSVVAVEQCATALRQRLRQVVLDEHTAGLVDCPCSVATQHRDIHKKPRNLSKSARDRDDED